MSTRRWIGLALLLSAVAFGGGLQAYYGTLFHIETTTTRERPEQHARQDDFTITEWEATTVAIFPNWPIAVPLAILACAGLGLLIIPRGTNWKRKPD